MAESKFGTARERELEHQLKQKVQPASKTSPRGSPLDSLGPKAVDTRYPIHLWMPESVDDAGGLRAA